MLEETIFGDVTDVLSRTFRFASDTMDRKTLLLNIQGGLALNSLQLIELVVALEERYGKEFNTDMFAEDDFVTVGAVCDLVRRSFFED